MVSIAEGDSVVRVLERALAMPRIYRKVVVASPYIDGHGLRLLDRLFRAAQKYGLDVEVVTTPQLQSDLGKRWAECQHFRLRAKRQLHGKVYGVLGFRRADHEVIVGSANLTSAGIRWNMEVGLRITGSSPRFGRLAEDLVSRVSR